MTSHPELEDNILPSSSQSPTIHPLYSSCVLLATTAAMGKKSMLLDASLPVTRELSLPEINALIPRRVQMSSEQPKMLLFSLLVFLATGAIWFGFYSYYSGHVQQREVLRRDGRELIAQITDLPSGKGQTYVQYTFRVGRVWYSGEAKLPDGPLEVAVGQDNRSPSVIFLPIQRQIIRLHGNGGWVGILFRSYSCFCLAVLDFYLEYYCRSSY
jgi:hypothetical protein